MAYIMKASLKVLLHILIISVMRLNKLYSIAKIKLRSRNFPTQVLQWANYCTFCFHDLNEKTKILREKANFSNLLKK